MLLTAIGKRVQLISYLKKEFEIVGTDCSNLNPAQYFVDQFYKVPSYNDENYILSLFTICQKEGIHVLIPLYEKEYPILDYHRKEFEEAGIALLLSNASVINICNDKYKTYEFFKKHHVLTPTSYLSVDEIKGSKGCYVVKPRDGMGSQEVYKVKNDKELEFFLNYIDNAIIQEFIEGKEYTVDVFCDRGGRVVSCVPRERLQVRSGEVSKAITRNHKKIISQAVEICEKLRGIGPLTLQCIEDFNGDIYWIEINPRFGGGVPLSMEAGIDYGKMIRECAEGKIVASQMYCFKPDFVMLRYDEAVFLNNKN
jgi:carbamoyl-phosphate synthase large subunit